LSVYCFLFDLDGTLVLTGGAGLRAFDRSFKKLFHTDGAVESISPAGKTDPDILNQICQDILGRSPLPDEEKQFFDQYVDFLKDEMSEATGFRIMPGIEALLEVLHGDERCFLGLGTGNIREGARIKLEGSGLWTFFSFGGFGSDSTSRPRLLEIAVARGKKLLKDGANFEAVYVIGDTPKDIHAGRAIGAQCIGVATGPYSTQELSEAGADRVYSDFSNPRVFLSDIGLL
jgi:phosphoglycolate phosphatase-like HAD superfamily hydrolase